MGPPTDSQREHHRSRERDERRGDYDRRREMENNSRGDRNRRERERHMDSHRHLDDRRDDRKERDRDRHGLPPPPPRPPSRGPVSSQGRMHGTPTRSLVENDRERQHTPVSGGQRRSTPVPSNVMVELLKHSKQMMLSKAAEDEEGEIHEAAGDADVDIAARKRKHSPIVWNPGSKHQRTDAQRPTSILERTEEELANFRKQQFDLGYDPDGPAALKSSPSVSGSAENDVYGSQRNGQDEGHGDMDEDEVAYPGARGTRWAEDNGDDEVPAPRKGGRGSGGQQQAREEAGGDGEGEPGGREASPSMAQGERERGDGNSSDGDEDFGSGPGGEPEISPRALLNSKYNMLRECRNVDEFEKIDRISEGTYGVVYKAREKATGRIVALKRIKMEKERDGFPVTSIREINILLNFHHPNIVNVDEVVVAARNPDHIFMVMEYAEHDLKSLMEDKSMMSRPFSIAEVKCLMLQLLAGVNFLHTNWVLHRDLKTSNILYNSKGDLKICDFGLARQYGSPLRPYTHMVVTLWYRAPELLFGQTLYSTAIDMWSVGAIMAELLTGKPIFAGQGEIDQVDKIMQVLGTPSLEDWPGLADLPNYKKINLRQVPSQLRSRFQGGGAFGAGVSLTEAGYDLLSRMLAYDPAKRMTAEEALGHRWFTEAPLPQRKDMMPTFGARKAKH